MILHSSCGPVPHVKNTAWWWLATPLMKIYEFISWDDEIPNEKRKMVQITNQNMTYWCLVGKEEMG